MTPLQPTRATSAHVVFAGLATLALALAACSASPSASPTASPSASQSASPTASPSASQSASSSANPPQTLHLFVLPGNEQMVHVNSLTGCPSGRLCKGDIYVGQDPLTDAASGKTVGTLLFECFVLDPDTSLYHCPGSTFDLTGRGQIVFSEQIYHDQSSRPATAPITGGSDEFLGATGTVISSSGPGEGEFLITITK